MCNAKLDAHKEKREGDGQNKEKKGGGKRGKK